MQNTILNDRRKESGWVTCIIRNRWVEAKVFDEPSTFGINEGRVSKLCIAKGIDRDRTKDFFAQMDYNYDRGLDFDNLPDGVLNEVIGYLENLPKVFS